MVLVALGAAVLLARGIITLTIPLAVFAGVAVTTAFTGAPRLHLLSGGLWLGAFYMATDYVTSPSTRRGQIVFGLADRRADRHHPALRRLSRGHL